MGYLNTINWCRISSIKTSIPSSFSQKNPWFCPHTPGRYTPDFPPTPPEKKNNPQIPPRILFSETVSSRGIFQGGIFLGEISEIFEQRPHGACKICTCAVSGSKKALRFGELSELLGDPLGWSLGDGDGEAPWVGDSHAPKGPANSTGTKRIKLSPNQRKKNIHDQTWRRKIPDFCVVFLLDLDFAQIPAAQMKTWPACTCFFCSLINSWRVELPWLHTSKQRRKFLHEWSIEITHFEGVNHFPHQYLNEICCNDPVCHLFFTDKDPTFLQLHPNNFAPQEHLRLLGPLVFLAPGEPPTWVRIHANTWRLHMNYPLWNSHLKIDGWKTFLSFRGFGPFEGRAVSFREGTHPLHSAWRILKVWYAIQSTPRKINMSPEKGSFQKKKMVFQPTFFRGFRGYVSFWASNTLQETTLHMPTTKREVRKIIDS